MDMDNCPICLDPLDHDVCELEECKHKFHSNCIVKWFRSQHTTCPLCKNQPNELLSEKSAKCRFLELKKQLRRKDAPKALVQAFKKLDKLKNKVKKRKAKRKALRAQVKKLRKTEAVKEFLKKQRQSSHIHDLGDNMKISDAEYVIGATDYGTKLLPITSRPLQFVQRIEIHNDDDTLLNQLRFTLPN